MTLTRLNKFALLTILLTFSMPLCAKALIDPDVMQNIIEQQTHLLQKTTVKSPIPLLIFLHSSSGKKDFLAAMSKLPDVTIQELGFMPAFAVTIPAQINLLNAIANRPEIAQISSNNAGTEELEITAQTLKLTPSAFYPEANNWWAHGYTGKKGIIGLIDDGIDPTHPALASKTLVTRKEGGSYYSEYLNGMRTAHGTGVACIYASNDPLYKGIAYGATTFVSGLSGAETADTSSLMLTMSTLDWMLNRSEIKPTIINYSMGHGPLACSTCPEWSGLAKVIDYVVNHNKILWVKSAGNAGYIAPTQQFPYASTLTVPGDNYNALTIANMSTTVSEYNVTYKTANRAQHSIRATSSRGPTPYGRRKPDLTAPGHDTRTCAPNPESYGFTYASAMDYHDGYRLMGGTSSAAPHVGASALLLQDAGIQNPIAIKALLINSADAWTDKGDSGAGTRDGHFEVMGSEWNRTYGWGYINMEKAYEQKDNIIESQLTLAHPVLEYQTTLAVGEKLTLVHERRVGYTSGQEWKLSHLTLEIIDMDTQNVVARDDSAIDSVHQVGNCARPAGQKECSSDTKPMRALVRVSLLSPTIDGSDHEPFALIVKTAKTLQTK